MEYTQELFMERMNVLVETGRKNENQVSLGDVMNALEGFSVDEERIRLVSQFLAAHKIEIEGLSAEEPEEELPAAKRAELSFEEEEDLKLYRMGLPEVSKEFQTCKAELFSRMKEGDAAAKNLLVNGYLSAIVDLALAWHEKEIDLSDLIQEGNLAMILALEEADADHKSLLAAINQAMDAAVSEVKDVSASNESVIGRVNKLKDAIEQLSDGEEMDFTVGELSLFLDMTEEEIRDILNLTGEK